MKKEKKNLLPFERAEVVLFDFDCVVQAAAAAAQSDFLPSKLLKIRVKTFIFRYQNLWNVLIHLILIWH